MLILLLVVITYIASVMIYSTVLGQASGGLLIKFKDIISPFVTSLGLVITIIIAATTLIFNQEHNDIDFIYTLMKNLKSLEKNITYKNPGTAKEKDFDSSVVELLTRIKLETNLSNIYYLRILKKIQQNKKILESEKIPPEYKKKFKKLKNEANIDRELEKLILYGIQNTKGHGIHYKQIYESHKNKVKKPLKDYKYKNLVNYIVSKQFITLLFDDDDAKGLYTKKISYDESFEIINNIYRIYYPSMGHYFKQFHRIVKLINKKNRFNKSLKKSLRGILRSQFTENELLLIYYNATYTARGMGLGYILKGSCFFGDTLDFQNIGNTEISHISKAAFILDNDVEVISNVYSRNNIRCWNKNNFRSKLKDYIDGQIS